MSDLPEIVLDACRLDCPMPLLKTKLALNGMKPGQRLRVWTTDAGSVRDIPAFLALTRHQLIGQCQLAEVYEFVILRGD